MPGAAVVVQQKVHERVKFLVVSFGGLLRNEYLCIVKLTNNEDTIP